MCSNYPGIKLEPALGTLETKLNICHHMLTTSTQLQNKSFHVAERTRTSIKCQKMKNARAKRAKILFFIVNYANLCGFCCRRRRGCLKLSIRDFKIRYGEVLLRLRKVKFTSGDVSTCVAVWLSSRSSRSMLFYYGKVLRLA